MKPHVQIAYVGAVYVRMMTFARAGDVEQGHSHTFDHLTILAQGSLEVESNGRKSVFKAPHIIVVPKFVVHRLTALEPNTVACCVHAMRPKGRPEELFDSSMLPAGTPPWSFIEKFTVD